MNKGKVAEFNKPSTLLSEEYQDNVFRQLVDETGAATASHLRKVANGLVSIFDHDESTPTPKAQVSSHKKKKNNREEDLKDSHHHDEHSHGTKKTKQQQKKRRSIGKVEKVEIQTNGVTNVPIETEFFDDDDEEQPSEIIEEEEEENLEI